MAAQDQSFDFIVIGSGAGGGVLAWRLARSNQGLKVLLIDAGSDPRANSHYQVPAKGLDHLLAVAKRAGTPRIVVRSFCGWPYARKGVPVKSEAIRSTPSRHGSYAERLRRSAISKTP